MQGIYSIPPSHTRSPVHYWRTSEGRKRQSQRAVSGGFRLLWLRGGTYGLVLFCSALVASGVRAPPSPLQCLPSAPSLGGWGHGVGAASPAALLLHPALPGPAAWGGTCCAPGGLLSLWTGQGGLPDHCSGRRWLWTCGDLCSFPLLWRQAHRTLCEYRSVFLMMCVCVYVFTCECVCVSAWTWQWTIEADMVWIVYKSLRDMRSGKHPDSTVHCPLRVCICFCGLTCSDA